MRRGRIRPWRAVTVRQPPVPPDGYRFAIALGLAMGRYADGAFCQFAPAAPTLRSASAAVVRGMGRVPAADSKPRDDRPVGFGRRRINELLLTAENGRTTALAANIPQLQQRQRQQQARLQRQAQRELTQARQSILIDLANLLPEQAWLTSLNYQQETLELEGLARTFDALLTLETSLRHYVSFPLNRTGATRQDAQGRWQFHYQLTRSAARERAL